MCLLVTIAINNRKWKRGGKRVDGDLIVCGINEHLVRADGVKANKVSSLVIVHNLKFDVQLEELPLCITIYGRNIGEIHRD